MPICSMTGFGAAARPFVGAHAPVGVEVEVRSVNGRHLDVRIRQPFGPRVEHELRARIEAQLGRGRVELAVTLRPAPIELGVEGNAHASSPASPAWQSELVWPIDLDLGPTITAARVDATLRAAAEIVERGRRASLELAAPNALEVLRFLHSLQRAQTAADPAAAPPSFLAELVDEALGELVEFRRREGEALATELAALATALREQTAKIAELAKDEPARWAERVRVRVRELCDAASVPAPDDVRMAQEVALLAAKSDVSEELARIASHLARFDETLAAPAAPGQGRTLEFVAQELVREVTTIGSKIGSHVAAALVIDAKGTLERIREQVQNVE
jgi:uncharacterized protein (TIGR00255 family)